MNYENNEIKNFISIVVYVKNNENHIKDFMNKIDKFMKHNFQMYEFIIVNNFSTDNSIKYIKEIKENINGKITIINLAWEHSKDACMMAGCDIAIGDFILEFENTFIDYDTNEILNIYNKSLEGYDIVAASPKDKTKFSEKLFYKLLKTGSKMNYEFVNESFRIISRRAINRIYKNNNFYSYRKVAYHYSGFNSYIYFYNPTKYEIYKDDTFISRFSNANNILLRYANFYYMLPLIYILIIIISIFIPCNKEFFLITTGVLWIILLLCFLIKHINFICKTYDNKSNYIYKSIERL